MVLGRGHKKSGGAGFLLAGIGAGAALMYYLDPAGGRRRRSLARDKVLHTASGATEQLRRVERDLANRSQGLVARMRQRLRRGQTRDDILRSRVRSALGHVCSHPALIRVSAHQGRVELQGPVLDFERMAVLSRVRVVPGVLEVDDDLEPFVTGESPAP